MTLLDQIPGYREAVEREAFERDLAFAEIGEYICGVEVVPLNWQRFIRLALIGSPFIRGGPVTPTDCAVALWLLSPKHCTSRWRRVLFMQRIRRIPFIPMCNAIEEYIRDALLDAPSGGDGESRVSYFSGVASQVDLFASEYGWSRYDVLTAPMKQLFQLIKCVRARNGDRMFFNPSDKVRGEWLKQQNEGKN